MEQEIQAIMQRFLDHGFQIYLVGGHVRDFLLGKPAKDVDFATDALPEEIEALFPKTLALGKSFGTVTIVGERSTYEVTTFRQDIGSQNFRKPQAVSYTTTLKEDVLRRDLTINGLAMTIAGEIIDYVGGQSDLDKKIIRTIGNPKQRFDEDALRILRALRFAIRLRFSIEQKTRSAMEQCAKNLQFIAKERLRKEWEMIVTNENYELAMIPETLAAVCFGETWRWIFQFPTVKPLAPTQFWAFVSLVSSEDWRYTKQEKRLCQRVKQRMQQPTSLRYIDLNQQEVLEFEQIVAGYQQRPFEPERIIRTYHNQIIKRRQQLAVTAQDLQGIGLEAKQFQAAFLLCAQAINEQNIPNTRQACLAYIKEEYYG